MTNYLIRNNSFWKGLYCASNLTSHKEPYSDYFTPVRHGQLCTVIAQAWRLRVAAQLACLDARAAVKAISLRQWACCSLEARQVAVDTNSVCVEWKGEIKGPQWYTIAKFTLRVTSVETITWFNRHFNWKYLMLCSLLHNINVTYRFAILIKKTSMVCLEECSLESDDSNKIIIEKSARLWQQL